MESWCVTPSPKPFGPDGRPLRMVEQLIPAMGAFKLYAERPPHGGAGGRLGLGLRRLLRGGATDDQRGPVWWSAFLRGRADCAAACVPHPRVRALLLRGPPEQRVSRGLLPTRGQADGAGRAAAG